ncbi:MAG TPA: hypothetical protein ENG36_03090 [Lentisphaerae bacterium]|nr:hypothetical protein [Lentisphaerota bacterium]
MKLRLSLLKEEEVRYPGRISRGAAIKIGVVAAVLLVVGSVGGVVLRARVIHSRLSRVKSELKKIDAPYQIVRGMQKDLAANLGIESDLEGWERARLRSAELLRKLQRLVPEEMELRRYTMFTGFDMIPPPKWKKGAPPTPGIRYTMRIEGRVISAFAETVVVEFLRVLKSAAGYGDLLESVRLERLHRDPTVRGEREARVFSVLLQSVIRPMETTEASTNATAGVTR